MFSSVLIANRGEIACRIIRTARRLGMRTVAVFSEADAGALHVRMADRAIAIGPAAAAESYLCTDRVLAAAEAAGADCIHPGYGFLAENAAFAEACASAGITFIGPPPPAIRIMGLKDAAKRTMEAAGVPVVPGWHGDRQDPELLAAEAERIGWPILIKAVAGGGGKGMRKVDDAAAFAAALDACRREAKAAFGDDRVLLERFVSSPRHIEFQVFVDDHGNAVHLYERECSRQRRHQKIIEEAPAPGMTGQVRAVMGAAAVKAAEAVAYRGAGTVEFIADGSRGLAEDAFWFMEMNTRLQVEHPVTEMITGLDLVELQFRVAAGEPLPFGADSVPAISGHAIEARLYAENPANGFLPQAGTVHAVRWPDGARARVDTGIEAGTVVSGHYDPMLAKLIVHGETRNAALSRLGAALADTTVLGLATNLGFLERIVGHPAFAAAEVDTGFVDRHLGDLVPATVPASVLAVAAMAWIECLARDAERPGRKVTNEPFSPWSLRTGWTLCPGRTDRLHLLIDGRETTADIRWETGTRRIRVRSVDVDEEVVLSVPEFADGRIAADVDGERLVGSVHFTPGRVFLQLRGHHLDVRARDLLARDEEEATAGGQVRAPMAGRLLRLDVEPGQTVAKGTRLAVLEAMKMEHALTAALDATVREVGARAGDQVEEGQVLVVLEPVVEQ